MSTHHSPLTTHAATPWYREPWPWILMAGPAAVIVAGAFTTWIAFTSWDGLVADDYYKRGLAINQELKRDQAALDRGIAAVVENREGVLRVRLSWGQSHFSTEQPGNATAPAGKVTLTPMEPLPDVVFARLVHATRAGHDQRLRLTLVAPGVYETGLPALPAGRWRVVLEDPRGEWRITPTLTLPLNKGEGKEVGALPLVKEEGKGVGGENPRGGKEGL